MKELTKAEEMVMLVLWELEEGTVWSILECIQMTPKPLYNTVSTFIRILENKGFVKHRNLNNRTYMYSPAITKEEYQRYITTRFVSLYFNNSMKEAVAYFAKELSDVEKKQLIDARNSASLRNKD
ncbi:putative transcriptional regulator [Runella defluvii]|uniref:Putative transcriptional regulator n=1 Tax=Runella defluvii TaxID=370973 RepID=A0A7W5ZRV4_9BACT|nr:BlaI/MecI/CopY family transcriptional regulator [Runella defluvii]MBB3841958.1 putative transcriptional regulator [Runella defluvii]